MKFILTMTGRGLITLPAAMRKQLGLKENDLFSAEVTPAGILLKPVATVPIEIYTSDRLEEFASMERELSKAMK